MSVENLGIANLRVKIYDSAPNIARKTKKYNFDVSAYNNDVIQHSPFFKPLLTECVEDPNGLFAAIHPAKRKFYLNNIMDEEGATPTTTPTTGVIKWKALATPPSGMPKNIVEEGGYASYTLIPPGRYASFPADYKGPIWLDNAVDMIAPPDDTKEIAAFIDFYRSDDDSGTTTTTTSGPVPIVSIQSAYQKQKRDGLWWAIESNDFLEENAPFWVNFSKMDSPSSSSHETCFIIRLGPESSEHKYDIYLSMSKRPRLFDYIEASEDSTLPPGISCDWDTDLSRIFTHNANIEVGIMTIAGRLVILVNNVPLIYNRINRESGEDGGKLLECKIERGKIQIFGTNCETRIIACPMTFAPFSVLALPLPTIISSEEGADPILLNYKGVNYKGEPYRSVAELPTPPSYTTTLFGVDCLNFMGDGGSCFPTGFGFHKKGDIWFEKAEPSLYSSLPSTDFYTLQLIPSSDTVVAGITLPYGGCPYFFRLKGIYEEASTPTSSGVDISDNVISVEETAQAPDYFQAKKNASITFYNPGNIIGDRVLTNQTAIDVTWGWTGGDLPSSSQKTFTGIVTSMSKSEVAGKETITLNCQDYMYMLSVIPIVNSPFYDGMVGYYAIRDIAQRAGINSFVKNWTDDEDYFLPAGYAFSQPKMRFNQSQMLLDCMINIVKRFEAYIFFDGDGIFHINKLDGGLFSDPGTSAPTGNFVSDMLVGGSGETILEERSVDISFESTVNYISVLTVDRDTRNAIFYTKAAEDDRLLFTKPYLVNQSALGELEVAKAWATDLGKRVFFPILKTRFKTSGTTSIVFPLDFITVDGHMFRVLSVKRSFNAETNDMSCSYECEWLGGA